MKIKKVDFMKNYNERIKKLRIDNDKNQTQIANILKTDQSYYSKYENGKRPLPIEHLIKLCMFYNVSADYILGFTNEKKPLPKQ